MDSSIISEFRWLMDEEAAKLLDVARADFSGNTNPLKIAKQLRTTVSPTRAALVMEQAQLRIRAKKKFPLAEQMFFTQRGLEQSSGHEIARYKAIQFADHEAIADICCGIGGDLMELATRNPTHPTKIKTIGIDIDPVTALFAEKNLELHLAAAGCSNTAAAVLETEFDDLDVAEYSGLHLDPDRRKGRRTTDGRHFSPALNIVFDRIADGQLVAVKVAPASPRAEYLPLQIHREWLGDPRECKQQILWLNADRSPGGKSATMITKNHQSFTIDCGGQEKVERVVAPKMLQFLYEPRSVVLAAGLEDHLAAKHELQRIAFDIPYYLCKHKIEDPLLARFQVLDLLKLDLKLIHSYLMVNDVGQIELKQRGIDKVTYDRVRKLKISGDHKATLILTRYGPQQKRRAIVAKRID